MPAMPDERVATHAIVSSPTWRVTPIVESFVIGPFLLKGTRHVAFVQQRLASSLQLTAELRILEPPCDIPPVVETLT